VLPSFQPKRPALTGLILEPGQTAYFSLQGMFCAGCAIAAKNVLRHRPGVRSADVSFAAERGRLQYDPAQVDPAALLRDLDRLGYRARLLSDPADQRTAHQQERTLLQLLTAAALGMLGDAAASFALDPAFAPHLLEAPQVLGPMSLGDYAITVRVMVKTRPGKQWEIARELRKRILAACDRGGIVLPHPRQETWTRNLSPAETLASARAKQ
jgi:cation transport ATPase